MPRLAAIVLTALLVGLGGAAGSARAHATADDCAPGSPLAPEAELFATNNTDTIADPADPRLQDRLEPFGSQVDGTVLANTADKDAAAAKRVVAASGGVLDMSSVRHGTSQFVP